MTSASAPFARYAEAVAASERILHIAKAVCGKP